MQFWRTLGVHKKWRPNSFALRTRPNTFPAEHVHDAVLLYVADQGCDLTLRKIAIWMYKKIAKNLTFFQKKLPKIVIFFKKNCQWHFFWKNANFWQFFDIQMAIFLKVRSDRRLDCPGRSDERSNLHCFGISVNLRFLAVLYLLILTTFNISN